MPTVKTQLQKGIGKAFTVIGRTFDPDTRTFLLKRAGESSAFQLVRELTDSTIGEHDAFRGQLRIMVSSPETELLDEIAQTSFIGYGRPDKHDAVEVYGIEPDRRDITAPTGTSPLWSIYCTKIPNERYIVEDL